MRAFHCLVILLLAALAAGQWAMVIRPERERQVRRVPAARLAWLLQQAQLNEKYLTMVAAQNAAQTTRTLAILERLAAAPAAPVAAPASAPAPRHAPDAPVVLYEAEPVRKGVRE